MKHWLQRALLVVPAVALLAFCSVSFAAGDQALNDQNSGAQNQDLNRDLNDGAARATQQVDRNADSGDTQATADDAGAELVGQDAGRISTARPEDRRSMTSTRSDATSASSEKWWWHYSWNWGWGHDDDGGSSGGHGDDDGGGGHDSGGHGGHGGKGGDMSPSEP